MIIQRILPHDTIETIETSTSEQRIANEEASKTIV